MAVSVGGQNQNKHGNSETGQNLLSVTHKTSDRQYHGERYKLPWDPVAFPEAIWRLGHDVH